MASTRPSTQVDLPRYRHGTVRESGLSTDTLLIKHFVHVQVGLGAGVPYEGCYGVYTEWLDISVSRTTLRYKWY